MPSDTTPNWKLNKFLHELFSDLGFTNIVKPPKKYGPKQKETLSHDQKRCVFTVRDGSLFLFV